MEIRYDVTGAVIKALVTAISELGIQKFYSGGADDE